jgi:hypothetical protein
LIHFAFSGSKREPALIILSNENASKEYLTIASENTSEKYKDSVFEKNAPQDVFSYLEFIENKELKN